MTSPPSSVVTLENVRSSGCTAAITANLSNCTLSQDAVPTQLWGLTSLTYLNLSGNQLNCISSHLSQLVSLTSLDLSANAFNDMPAEVYQLTGLMDLNIGRNNLSAVSSQLGSLTKLKYLNLMNNSLTDLPTEIGNLRQLYRLGLKSNKLTSLPDAICGLVSLVELFITGNHLKSLPDGMSGLHSLVKLQASFNQLQSLPAAMGQLPKLELMRVAVNNIQQVPREFSGLQSLAWFSLAGNPACQSAPPIRPDILPLTMDQLELDKALGDGASGDVFAAKFKGRDVAVKVFKAETSPDGHARDEIAVTCHVDHPNLIKVIGIIDHPHALVLERVWGSPLALKPNFESLLRCRWQSGQTLALDFVMKVAIGVASALEYLHHHRICHGDVYGHNVLADSQGNSVLCDYGASFFYQEDRVPYQQQEVRAYSLLLNDLVARLELSQQENQLASCQQRQTTLHDVVQKCAASTGVLQRPKFQQIVQMLKSSY